jgi:UDP-glucose 4-epimerase
MQMELEGARVLITGGAGLIGSHIADLLVQENAGEIVVFDNFVRGQAKNLAWALANGPVRIVRGDIRDTVALAEAMQGVDLVFHQAAIRITQCADEPRLALQVLADGTFNVLEAAVDAQVKKVVAASSASVYGLADHFPTTEKAHPYNNRTLYGAAKVFNEGLLRSFNDMFGLDYVGLRYFNVYGPRMDTYGAYTEVLIRWMERIASNQRPLIFGDGTQTMDFIYVEDIARANILAMQADVSDEVFNVASGVETSLNELAYALLDVMGSDLEPEYAPARKVNPVPRRLADTQRAARMIGFRAEVPLEEGLRRLVDWWAAEGLERDDVPDMAPALARAHLAGPRLLPERVSA